MANEFIARKGLIALENSQVTGSLNISGSITANNLSGTNTGDQDLSSLATKVQLNTSSSALQSNIDAKASVAQLNTSSSELRADLVANSATASFVTNSQTSSFSTATGVENNADVTDTANVTAAGALMDSELTEIATVKALTKAGISGSFNASSASFNTRVTTLEGNVGQALNTDSTVEFTHVTSSKIAIKGGSVSSPSIHHHTDPDTGLFFPALNSVALQAGGGDTEFSVSSNGATARVASFNVIGSITASNNISASNVIFNDADINGTLSLGGFSDVSASLAAAVAGGDNLGNHTATQDLDLDGNSIKDILHITASGAISASGNITAPNLLADSASFSTRVTANDAKLTANTSNVTSAGALMDSELAEIATVKALTKAGISGSFNAASASFSTRVTANDAKLTANTSNVTAAGALMDSELTSLSSVKAINQGLTTTSDVTFNDVDVDGTLTIPGFANVSASLAAAVAGGDNLGNHTATQDLDLDGNSVKDVLHITASGNISASGTNHMLGGDLTITGSLLVTGGLDIDSGDSTFRQSVQIGKLDRPITLTGGTSLLATRPTIEGGGSSYIDFTTGINLTTEKKISFDSDTTNTYIAANNENPEDLEIHADQDIILNPDGQVIANSHISASGAISASAFKGDGSALTNLPSQTDENFTTADHTKLDGIEANADVTDTTNVTAAGALMDSELAEIATVKALTKAGISGSFNAASASFSTRVTANDAKVSYTDAAVTSVINTAGVISGSAQFGSSDNVTFGTIEATSLNVTSITSSIVTSSIVQTEGSNIFGDANTDTQTFNGHITASGNISASGTIIGSNLSGTNTGDQDLSSYIQASQTSSFIVASQTSSFSTATGVEDNADVTDTSNVTAAGALMDSELAEIATVKALTKAGISGSFNAASASFSTRVTANDAKTGYTDAAVKTKLDAENVISGSAANVRSLLNVEDGADVTDTSNVTSAGALMDSELAEIATVKSLTAAGISGSFNAASASFSTRVTANDAKLTANTSNVTNAGALMDSEVTNLAQVKAFDSSDYATAAQGTKADTAIQPSQTSSFSTATGVEDNADVTDTANVTSAGALMDSELAEIATVKSLTAAGISGSFNAASASFSTRVTANDAKLTANTSNVTSAGALMDSEVTNLSFVKGLTGGISDGNVLTANDAVADDDFLRINGTEVEGLTAAEVRTALNVENGADVTDTANVTSAGALMDSELSDLAAVKAINQGLTTTSNVAFNNITASGTITATGQISSSGFIYGDRYYVDGHLAIAELSDQILFGYENDTPIQIGKSANPTRIVGHLSASIISASSGIAGHTLTIGGTQFVDLHSSGFRLGSATETLNIFGDTLDISPNVTASGNISASGTITGNSIVGTLATAAQTNITSVGTLGSLTMGGDIDMDGNTITMNSGEINGAAQVDASAFRIGNGSAGTPALAFTNDTNTGLYAVAVDTLGIAAGGSLNFSAGSNTNSFSKNVAISVADGDGAILSVTNTYSGTTSADSYAIKAVGNAVVGIPGGQNQAYAGHFTAGNTNTSNPDTIALYAQGHEDGAPNSYAAIFSGSAGGIVGINTMEPTVELDIVGTLAATKTKLAKTTTDVANHNGEVVFFGGTTSMDNGKIYYYNASGGWTLANADALADSKGLLAVALGDASDTDGMLIRGMVTLDHDPGAVADVLYLSTTDGQASSTAPSSNNHVVRVLGYCLDASNGQIYFNPSNDFIVITA